MLSRRHIRIKVLQALYEFFQNENTELKVGERKLLRNIQKIYELYLFELKSLADIVRIAHDQIELKKQKKLPTQEDLNPNYRFVENSFLQWLIHNENFQKEIEEHHVSWGEDREILRKLFREFQKSEEYVQYMQKDSGDLDEDKRIVKVLYGRYLTQSDLLHQLYEDKEMHWADDLDAAQMMVSKTIKAFNPNSNEKSPLQRLIKDSSDRDFALTLFRKTVVNGAEYEKLIHEKAQNWELDRIALLDVILMKMALAELVNFRDIPVKVTLNEYIDLSKEYSSPRSGNFINGVLDKLKIDLSEKGDIKKIGRGLL